MDSKISGNFVSTLLTMGIVNPGSAPSGTFCQYSGNIVIYKNNDLNTPVQGTASMSLSKRLLNYDGTVFVPAPGGALVDGFNYKFLIENFVLKVAGAELITGGSGTFTLIFITFSDWAVSAGNCTLGGETLGNKWFFHEDGSDFLYNDPSSPDLALLSPVIQFEGNYRVDGSPSVPMQDVFGSEGLINFNLRKLISPCIREVSVT